MLSEWQRSGDLPSGTFNLNDESLRNEVHDLIGRRQEGLQKLQFPGREAYDVPHKHVYEKFKHYLRYLRRKERLARKMGELCETSSQTSKTRETSRYQATEE